MIPPCGDRPIVRLVLSLSENIVFTGIPFRRILAVRWKHLIAVASVDNRYHFRAPF